MGERIHGAAPTGPEPSQVEPAGASSISSAPPSGSDCRPSDQTPSGFAAYGASIPRAGEVSGLVEDLINFSRLHERLIYKPSEVDEAAQVALEIEETKENILSAFMARATLKDANKMTSRPGFSDEEERQVAASERIFAAVHIYLTEMEETEDGGEDVEIRQFEAMKAAIAVADRARDQRAEREDAQRLRSETASPMPEGQAPDLKALQAENERLRADIASYERTAQVIAALPSEIEIDRLTTALAESERKRVEAETALQEWRSGIAELGRVWKIMKQEPARPTPKIRELFGATPTQETPDDQG